MNWWIRTNKNCSSTVVKCLFIISGKPHLWKPLFLFFITYFTTFFFHCIFYMSILLSLCFIFPEKNASSLLHPSTIPLLPHQPRCLFSSFLSLLSILPFVSHVYIFTCISLSRCSKWKQCQVTKPGPSWEKSMPPKLAWPSLRYMSCTSSRQSSCKWWCSQTMLCCNQVKTLVPKIQDRMSACVIFIHFNSSNWFYVKICF